jgi:hypothetical protein
MFGVTSEDLRNLSVAALLGHMIGMSNDSGILSRLQGMLSAATRAGVAQEKAGTVLKAVQGKG